jgi:hypothetical protein
MFSFPNNTKTDGLFAAVLKKVNWILISNIIYFA